jgi:hypothetical protein
VDLKAQLHSYLQVTRGVVVAKCDGLSDRPTTLGALLVRMVDETAHHAGHADICREIIDGQGQPDRDQVGDDAFWSSYVARIQAAADSFQ